MKWVWRYALGGRNRASLKIQLEAMFKWVWSCTWGLWLSELGDASGDRDQASLEIHLDAVVQGVWRYALGGHDDDAVGGRNWVILDIQVEGVINQVGRSTGRPQSSGIGAVHGGGQAGGGNSGGRRNGSWHSLHWVTHNCGNVENWVQHDLRRDEGLPENRRQSILPLGRTRCMQYSVCAILGVFRTHWILYSV